jgi:predicted amidohydrolase
MHNLKITIIQSDLIWEDVQANLHAFEKKISDINNTDIIVLPEMFNSGFSPNFNNYAENSNGKTIQWLKNIAKEKKCVVTGSLLIKENNSYYNRLIWMNTDGNYQKYDKRHLFRPAKEHIYSSKGNKKLIVETKGWKIRPLVCYDLRFPVWSKNTFTDIYEYDCLIYIANWPKHKNYHWKSLLIARAIENQSYIIGVNRIGIDGNKVPFSGYSMVINPKGKIISKTKSDTESIETIELSKYKMENYRKQFTVALDWDKFKII